MKRETRWQLRRAAAKDSPPRYATAAERWQAVVRRDARAEGAFVFGVQTTGVYCRPGCAARLPLRLNVSFFDSTAAAERAGFRACRRCRPNEPSVIDTPAAKVAAACRQIESAPEPPALADLAKAAGLSPFHFHRLFKRMTGLTPKAYANARRAQRLRRALGRRGTVTEAIYEAGFSSSGRVYAESDRCVGMNPKQFQRGGAGETIQFAVGESSLGAILVAASPRGICAITLGDDPGGLISELAAEFPRAVLRRGDSRFARWVAQVVGALEGGAHMKLPLDLRGTVFQRRVWVALRKIPVGATASYTELARRLGTPRAIRAVAGACAANRLAVAIPCHRVVRSDGGLAGYRWGVDRKRALLLRERRQMGRGQSVAR